MTTQIPLHPDDVLFFHEVRDAMRVVAIRYGLRLQSIKPFPMPAEQMADRLGDCTHDGHIRLVLRATEHGTWCPNPRTPEKVWLTAAHELAHLKHFNHGTAHGEFTLELEEALRNLQEDHKEKVIKKLVKMTTVMNGEAALGNTEAAEAFAQAINRLMLENELAPSQLDYARSAGDNPIVELPVDFGAYSLDKKKARIAWQDTLARIIAKSHLCTYLVRRGSNQIWFVGTKTHAIMAEYAFGTLVPLTEQLADKEYYDYHMGLRREGRNITLARGFRPSWIAAFIERIEERFESAKRAAVAEAPEGTSVALMRLDGALQRARAYVDDKFKSKIGSVQGIRANHSDARRLGRAAADRMNIGQRGVSSGAPKGLLK